MRRFLYPVFLLGLIVYPGSAQDETVDPAKLERIRKMSPEQRKQLLEIIKKIKKMPEEEQVRLQENLQKFKSMSRDEQRRLRQRAKKLSKEERKVYRGLIVDFNRSIRRGDKKRLKGFPRGLFFVWVRNSRPADFSRLKDLSPEARWEVYQSLSSDFVREIETRMRKHLRKHRCVSPRIFEKLYRPDGSINWTMWQRFVRQCRAKRQKFMRRKPPRWH